MPTRDGRRSLPSERATAIATLWRQNYSVRAIAEIVGCAKETVRRFGQRLPAQSGPRRDRTSIKAGLPPPPLAGITPGLPPRVKTHKRGEPLDAPEMPMPCRVCRAQDDRPHRRLRLPGPGRVEHIYIHTDPCLAGLLARLERACSVPERAGQPLEAQLP